MSNQNKEEKELFDSPNVEINTATTARHAASWLTEMTVEETGRVRRANEAWKQRRNCIRKRCVFLQKLNAHSKQLVHERAYTQIESDLQNPKEVSTTVMY